MAKYCLHSASSNRVNALNKYLAFNEKIFKMITDMQNLLDTELESLICIYEYSQYKYCIVITRYHEKVP